MFLPMRNDKGGQAREEMTRTVRCPANCPVLSCPVLSCPVLPGGREMRRIVVRMGHWAGVIVIDFDFDFDMQRVQVVRAGN